MKRSISKFMQYVDCLKLIRVFNSWQSKCPITRQKPEKIPQCTATEEIWMVTRRISTFSPHWEVLLKRSCEYFSSDFLILHIIKCCVWVSLLRWLGGMQNLPWPGAGYRKLSTMNNQVWRKWNQCPSQWCVWSCNVASRGLKCGLFSSVELFWSYKGNTVTHSTAAGLYHAWEGRGQFVRRARSAALAALCSPSQEIEIEPRK